VGVFISAMRDGDGFVVSLISAMGTTILFLFSAAFLFLLLFLIAKGFSV
jgi:hypothetical protein